jgi:hypothetical protein
MDEPLSFDITKVVLRDDPPKPKPKVDPFADLGDWMRKAVERYYPELLRSRDCDL